MCFGLSLLFILWAHARKDTLTNNKKNNEEEEGAPS